MNNISYCKYSEMKLIMKSDSCQVSYCTSRTGTKKFLGSFDHFDEFFALHMTKCPINLAEQIMN